MPQSSGGEGVRRGRRRPWLRWRCAGCTAGAATTRTRFVSHVVGHVAPVLTRTCDSSQARAPRCAYIDAGDSSPHVWFTSSYCNAVHTSPLAVLILLRSDPLRLVEIGPPLRRYRDGGPNLVYLGQICSHIAGEGTADNRISVSGACRFRKRPRAFAHRCRHTRWSRRARSWRPPGPYTTQPPTSITAASV